MAIERIIEPFAQNAHVDLPSNLDHRTRAPISRASIRKIEKKHYHYAILAWYAFMDRLHLLYFCSRTQRIYLY